jgi:uncharacterized protein YcbK (DUF882 family)
MGNLTENFSEIEFTCRCGCDTYLDSKHIAKELQKFRDWLSIQLEREVPLVVHCGCRCPEHNFKVGGVKYSHHLPTLYQNRQGAADIHGRGLFNWKLRKYAKKAFKLGIIKGGLGLYFWGIHIDCGPKRRWGHFWNIKEQEK